MYKRFRYVNRQMRLAYINLLATGLRSILAILGIIAGTGSIVAMVSSGEMAMYSSLARFRDLGTNLLSLKLSTLSSSEPAHKTMPFTLEEAQKLQILSAKIDLLAPYLVLYPQVTYHLVGLNAPVIATTEDLASILHISVAYGRFISYYDNYEPYCVIGNQVAKKLDLANEQAVGNFLNIGNYIFTIIGVAEPWPENGFFEEDINNDVIVPIKTAKLLFPNQEIDIPFIVMTLREGTDLNKIQTLLKAYTDNAAPTKKVVFRSAREILKNMEAHKNIFELFLALIGGISLLVGGIGVTNVMYMNVLERRREIGIRLALGATPSEIQKMFVIEAIILSMTGGIAGIIVGVISSFIVAKIANWSFQLFFWPAFLGFTMSVLTGLVFGYYPARQASRLHIIEVLRIE